MVPTCYRKQICARRPEGEESKCAYIRTQTYFGTPLVYTIRDTKRDGMIKLHRERGSKNETRI